jgi:hypothetical protein
MSTYGSEAWATCRRNERRNTAAEIKFMERTEDYTCLDFIGNSHMMKELNKKSIK